MELAVKRCVDCAPRSRRQAKYPGPRCFTHHKEVRQRRSAARKAAHVERTYSITEEQYQTLLAAQGGACYICRRRPFKKRLAVDHDHKCCNGPISCGKCVRGLLCRTCNRYVLGHLRDDPAAMERAAGYVRNPPARTVLGI